MSEMKASAYIHQGTLCLLGIHDSPWGPIPFAAREKIEGESKDGPVEFGKELPENIEIALAKANQSALDKVSLERLQLGSRDLVLRARQGDQNAMGTISMVRKNAEMGHPRAQITYTIMKEFIESHPATEDKIIFSGETHNPYAIELVKEETKEADPDRYSSAVIMLLPAIGAQQAAVLLANGPDLTEDSQLDIPPENPRVQAILRCISEDFREVFLLGLRCKNLAQANTLGIPGKLGFSVGLARTIQGVRDGKIPIREFSPMASWELGE